MVRLLVLVAVRAVDETRRRGEQVERVVDHPGLRGPLAAALVVGERTAQAVAVGAAAVVGRERAVAADLAAVDGALGHVLAGAPAGAVAQQVDLRAVALVAARQPQHRVAAVQVLGLVPGAVVPAALDGAQQRPAAAHPRAAGRQRALVAVGAGGELRIGALDLAQVADAGGAGGGEVAVLGGEGALAVAQALDQLGDQEVQVHVALAVRVAGHVHRHAQDEGGEVAAVVEVVAAQEVLVGLAVAAVLGDGHAGHRLQQLGRAQQRAQRQALDADLALGGAARFAELRAAADADGVQRARWVGLRGGVRRRCCHRDGDGDGHGGRAMCPQCVGVVDVHAVPCGIKLLLSLSVR